MLLSSNWMTVFLEGKQKMAWLARLARVVRLQTRRWSERTSQSQLNLIDQLLPRQAKGGGHDWPPPVKDDSTACRVDVVPYPGHQQGLALRQCGQCDRTGPPKYVYYVTKPDRLLCALRRCC
ncbi:hypothetical protein OsJ_29011 [Oryza sativa Japonica Group]|nr:hypothetical protein OsJ_29011 [Oryza sativa Japonica Group]